MTEGSYKIGDVIWAKMKSYPPWPARIAAPNETNIRNTEAEKRKPVKPYYLVYFFGSNNYAWMSEETLKPYKEFEEEYRKKSKKTAQFTKGLKAIEEYMRKVEDGTLTPPPEPVKEEDEEDEPNDIAPSPSGDSLSNNASNLDAPSVQRDYSRTPFNQPKRKSTKIEEPTTEVTAPTKRVKAKDDDYDEHNFSSPTISTTTRTQDPSKIQARNIITKGQQNFSPVVDTPQVDASFRTTRYKDIRASPLKFGFLGLGMMGQQLVKHLIGSRHSVTVWNRNMSVLESFEKAGATLATTPGDVIQACDITFSCLSGPSASKEVLFSQFGVLSEMGPGKSYVELSSIDPETSVDISDAIISKGGNFLAAPIVTSGKTAATRGDLIIIASGDRHVYDECASSCFKAMATKSFYLTSDCEAAPRMNLIASSLYGTIVGSVIECLRMLERCDLKGGDFLEIIKLSTMNSPLAEQTLQKVLKKRQDVDVPINYLQKDLRMMLNMSEEKDTGCPITAIVNEVFKSKKRLADGGDVSALYYASV
uniref:Cytokine-like nuclear factor N-PAC n=1 Tax=Aceria tosichella TaxID=561515 RepID=A0A6G1S8T7_9ACAR